MAFFSLFNVLLNDDTLGPETGFHKNADASFFLYAYLYKDIQNTFPCINTAQTLCCYTPYVSFNSLKSMQQINERSSLLAGY